ncbi:MAG: hypothetical protein AMJ81_00725 [Phycisphaerae bacterium SM23_33]|nr:MAG: hypothetical protein AMJ81_00725 [Phycisphaerae bacterium SM23_33]
MELLVVVGVISLLVTIVVPTLGRARELARQAVCVANQRSMVSALLAYHSDWGTFPYNYAYYDPYVDENVRWALGCISPQLGGPAGVVDLRGRDEGDFPRIYVCPSADLAKVYLSNPNDKYHACYWTSIAIRVNRGFGGAAPWGLFDTHGHEGMPPGWDEDSGGEARVFGTTCPRIGAHWRSLYQPTLDSVPLPDQTVFSGCTNNRESQQTLLHDLVRSYRPGHWDTHPGWGYMHGCLSFDRHADRQLMSYLDGSARAVAHQYLDNHFTHWGVPSGLTGDFLIRFTYEYSCRGTGIHTLPEPVVE